MPATTQTWVDLVELAVGGGCLFAAAGALRRRMRLVAVVLLVAGLAATLHAMAALVTR